MTSLRFSLLTPHVSEESDEILLLRDHIEKAMEDISLDRALETFARDRDSLASTSDILRELPRDPETVRYRQEVLQDFIASPRLLEELRLTFRSYDTLETTWRELRSSIFMMGMPASAEGILDSTYDSLKVTADFTRKTVSYFRSVLETIEKYQVTSAGLTGIRDYCRRMVDNSAMQEIARIAELFKRSTADEYTFRVLTQSDDALRIVRASLSEAREQEAKTFGSRMRKLAAGLGRSREDPIPHVDLGTLHDEDARSILSKALYELYSVLGSVAEAVYNLFRGISAELCFYDTGVRYYQYLKGNNALFCWPEPRPMEEDRFETEGLYDIHLILDGLSMEEITPMDFRFADTDGVVIRGPSATGKTAALRAMGAAQLLGQSGWPVCAKSMVMSLRGAIFTQFSAAERDFDANDEAGRFEGEVKEMAHILDAMAPWSLLLLNETFQTTAYSEGAVGMRDILECMPRLNCRYAFVTQMSIMDSLNRTRVTALDFRQVFRTEK